MFGQLFDIEGRTRETIKNTLEDLAEELGCSHEELFIKIAAKDKDFTPVFHVFITEPYSRLDTIPRFKFVREIELKEILET